MENPVDVLKAFLAMPLHSAEEVFEKFRSLGPHIYRQNPENSLERFLFIEGTRSDRVVLVAHADTYFDERYGYPRIPHELVEREGIIYSNNDGRLGLGADDRAGCAILWWLRNSGHSLLITDGEEKGCIGSKWIMEAHPDIAGKLNAHQFMVQVDRRNAKDFKCYSVGSDAFRTYIASQTGYFEPDRIARTDIVLLCRSICGVNFSIGYYDEHNPEERIVIAEWLDTLSMLQEFLSKEMPTFELSGGGVG